jgi:pimeloyl-ACP methyl ester carboxylesterase
LSDDTRSPPTLARLRELATMLPRAWRLAIPSGPLGPKAGPPCLVLPGFLAHDRSTLRLRQSFAAAGWRVHGWESGLNLGARADTLDRLARRLDTVADGRKVLLVGWSLGGVFARELAHRRPDQMEAVVSLGSPFSGDPTWNNVWRVYERVAGHPVHAPPIARSAGKPPVPTLALWSRRDGIIAPRAAYGLPDESDAAVELTCTHLGFAVTSAGTREVVQATRRFLAEQGLRAL